MDFPLASIREEEQDEDEDEERPAPAPEKGVLAETPRRWSARAFAALASYNLEGDDGRPSRRASATDATAPRPGAAGAAPRRATCDALTDDERRDIATWRLRLMAGPTFQPDYVPEKFEQKEMAAIAEFLGLEEAAPEAGPDATSAGAAHRTRRAVRALFHPAPGAPRSLLLKRGPVLLDRGEDGREGGEWELMLFTRGFLVARVELDALVEMLLDAGGPGEGPEEGGDENGWSNRFRDLDLDGSGSLDRDEIRMFFHRQS